MPSVMFSHVRQGICACLSVAAQCGLPIGASTFTFPCFEAMPTSACLIALARAHAHRDLLCRVRHRPRHTLHVGFVASAVLLVHQLAACDDHDFARLAETR